MIFFHLEPLQGRGRYEEIRRVGEAYALMLSAACVRRVAPKGCLVAGSIGSYGASPWPYQVFVADCQAAQWCGIYGRFPRPGDCTSDLRFETCF